LPVKVAHICEFGRMKRFKPISAVVPALRDSEFLEVTGPEGLEEIKRKYPYDPDAKRPKSEPRSIYAKGFGDEEPSSQFDIEAFFSPYGPINSVRLRRTDDKLFKGSVFVEFQDVETAKKFLELDPKPLWKGEHVLKIMPKKQYQDEKVEEIRDGKIRPGPTHNFRGRGRGRGDRGGNRDRNDRDRGGLDRRDRDKGDRDPDDWKKRREDDRANGFRDDRNGRDHKGGRGRGRGRHDRGPRDNDRNRERDDREEKNGYDRIALRLNSGTNSEPVMILRRRSTPSLIPPPKNPKLRLRSVRVRMMEKREHPQRRSIPSPMLPPSLHDTLSAFHFTVFLMTPRAW
jgi:lupus La protein